MSGVAQRLSEALAENEKLRAACADLFSVRDQFAKSVLQGLCANPGGPFQANDRSGWDMVNCTSDSLAREAYQLADAMIRARNAGVTGAPAHDEAIRSGSC
jgi:hypothetical protein